MWNISGDSEAAFHERQNISFQVNQLLQEAEWQANAADAQATSALHSLAIPMPDLSLGNGVPKAPANESWYDRVVDWFKEQGHEFVVAYEKHWTTGNIWYDELNYWTLGIPDKVEKVFHTKPFSLENLEANLDLFVSVVPATKAESVALDGMKIASNAAEEKMTEQEATKVEEALGSKDTVDSKTQGLDVSKETDKAKFTYKNNPMENPKAAKDILENPDAVYGYSPKPESNLSQFNVDWSNPEQVANAQAQRIEYHEGLKKEKAKLNQEVEELLNKGYTIEDIARMKVKERNAHRIETYIKEGNLDGLEAMKARNMRQYQNPEGPTPEHLFEKYGSWEEVINSSVRSNPGMDACTGLYDIYGGN